MILSFINIRKVPQEMLKTSGEHFSRDLANVEWKIIFDPSLWIIEISSVKRNKYIHNTEDRTYCSFG